MAEEDTCGDLFSSSCPCHSCSSSSSSASHSRRSLLRGSLLAAPLPAVVWIGRRLWRHRAPVRNQRAPLLPILQAAIRVVKTDATAPSSKATTITALAPRKSLDKSIMSISPQAAPSGM
jgi:hypothetical protein